MFETQEIEKENPIAEKMAKIILMRLEDFAGYRKDRTIPKKFIDVLVKEIESAEKKEMVAMTDETYNRVEDIIMQKLSKKGESDIATNYIKNLFEEVKKRLN